MEPPWIRDEEHQRFIKVPYDEKQELCPHANVLQVASKLRAGLISEPKCAS
jgi:hypothetical protein